MKVKKITVSNLKAISALTADFNGCTAIITGGNNKGKSSFLRSLPERLQGKKPEIVVKQNETEGFAEWELTDGSKFIWKFDTKTKKGESLTFITKDGIKASVTKGIAQRYFSFGFDIDEFLASPRQKQTQMLQRLVGLDFAEIDGQYKYAYEERTRLNTIAKNEQSKVVPVNDKLPEKTVDTKKLQEEILAANSHNKKIGGIQTCISVQEQSLKGKKEELARLQKDIATCEKSIASNRNWLNKNPEIDIQAKREEYEKAHDLNKQIQANEVAKNQKQLAEKAVSDADTADTIVQDIVKKREEMVHNANTPVGFKFTESGILYNDLPLTKEQQSSSSLYIAALKLASMNLGEVKTLYFDASTLDKNSLAEIETWANENDLQLLIERPDFDGKDIQYVIRETETSAV